MTELIITFNKPIFFMKDFEDINRSFGTSYKSDDEINWNKISCQIQIINI